MKKIFVFFFTKFIILYFFLRILWKIWITFFNSIFEQYCKKRVNLEIWTRNTIKALVYENDLKRDGGCTSFNETAPIAHFSSKKKIAHFWRGRGLHIRVERFFNFFEFVLVIAKKSCPSMRKKCVKNLRSLNQFFDAPHETWKFEIYGINTILWLFCSIFLFNLYDS